MKKNNDWDAKNKKKDYVQKIGEKLKEEGSSQLPYTTIKQLKSADQPTRWDVRDLNPDMTDEELANDLSRFFNGISDEFSPLTEDDIPQAHSRVRSQILPHEISARLRTCKKPKSMLDGDIFPSLVSDNCDILAIPLTSIYNNTIDSGKWPSPWKEEITTIIPKCNAASTYRYGECRNLSYTPLFSKVLETFMMDRINEETRVDPTQFEGIKKCGAEHFLIETFDNIHRGLEDNRGSINLISIDYAKAFNRMSRQACLLAYKKKGASRETLKMIASFLKGRTMRVKIGTILSDRRTINGGSPQGCVSVNALFCTTIEALQSGELDCRPLDAAFAPDLSTSTCYAGETILANIPSLEESSMDFEENGWDVPYSAADRETSSGFVFPPISPPSRCKEFGPPVAESSPSRMMMGANYNYGHSAG